MKLYGQELQFHTHTHAKNEFLAKSQVVYTKLSHNRTNNGKNNIAPAHLHWSLWKTHVRGIFVVSSKLSQLVTIIWLWENYKLELNLIFGFDSFL